MENVERSGHEREGGAGGNDPKSVINYHFRPCSDAIDRLGWVVHGDRGRAGGVSEPFRNATGDRTRNMAIIFQDLARGQRQVGVVIVCLPSRMISSRLGRNRDWRK